LSRPPIPLYYYRTQNYKRTVIPNLLTGFLIFVGTLP
jgi:hypothetical protein